MQTEVNNDILPHLAPKNFLKSGVIFIFLNICN